MACCRARDRFISSKVKKEDLDHTGFLDLGAWLYSARAIPQCIACPRQTQREV